MDDKDVEDKDDKARAGPDLTRFPVASPDGRALVDVHPRSLGDQYRARCRGMRSVPLAPVVHALDTVADPAACVVLDLHASGKAHWHFAVYEDSKGLMASGCIRLGGLERTHLRHGSARLPTPAAPGRPDRARSQRQRPRYAGAPTRPPIRTASIRRGPRSRFLKTYRPLADDAFLVHWASLSHGTNSALARLHVLGLASNLFTGRTFLLDSTHP